MEYIRGIPFEIRSGVNFEWTRQNHLRTNPETSLPNFVKGSRVRSYSQRLDDNPGKRNFLERAIISSSIPVRSRFGSECGGTALYLAGLIPQDIPIPLDSQFPKFGPRLPRISDYLSRLKENDRVGSEALMVLRKNGKVDHLAFCRVISNRSLFIHRLGTFHPIQGFFLYSFPRMSTEDEITYYSTRARKGFFDDLFDLSLEFAKYHSEQMREERIAKRK